jgi:hypothetical protein
MSLRLTIRCVRSQLSRNDVVAVRWRISSLVTVTSTSSLSASQFLATMSQITSGTSKRRMMPSTASMTLASWLDHEGRNAARSTRTPADVSTMVALRRRYSVHQ